MRSKKLTFKTVEVFTGKGRHSIRENLYLNISDAGTRGWVFLYAFGKGPTGKPRKREMGLGSAAKGRITLEKARELARDAQALLDQGIDPLEHRRATENAAKAIPNLGTFADEYIQTHQSKFRNAKHIAQWQMTLGDAYCSAIRQRPINTIDTEAVLSVLTPVWSQVPETALRLRGRIENIIDAAKARQLYQGDNPARWKGHLKALLPARQKLTRGHHSALPYDDLPAFMQTLRTRKSSAALALELTVLCATRSSQTLEAMWSEIDFEKSMWTIPRHRMKAGLEHRIPLSSRAVEILRQLHDARPEHSEFVFLGNTRGKTLSGMAMSMQLRRMNRDDTTVHGMRSTFRDWASEQTSFPHETCEHALAHRISDKAEAAYRRGDQLEKRRQHMEAWAAFCEPQAAGNVVALSGTQRLKG